VVISEWTRWVRSGLPLTLLLGAALACNETPNTILIGTDATSSITGDTDTAAAQPGSCPPGASLGCVTVFNRKVCNDAGTAFVEIPCGTGELCLGTDECVPALCVPGDRKCTGLYRIGECSVDGSGYATVEECGPGLTCEEGECVSACNSGQKATTNVGCNYALVDLGNFESEAINAKTDKPVLVVVSNVSGSSDATIEIISRKTGVKLPFSVAEATVPKQDLRTFLLPIGQAQLTTSQNRDSWLLTSDQPITVTLINPQNGLDVRSNDASLLFPTDALGTDYLVMGWKSFWTLAQGLGSDGFPKYGFPSYVTIIATSSGQTTVTVTPSTDVHAGVALDGTVLARVPSGQTRTHTLNEGDVLNYAVEPRVGEGDLTGTAVTSDKPIAVFAAHNCAFVPDINTPFCDHMEMQLAPVDTWGKTYIADLFAPRSPTGYYDIFRVMASRDGTVVTAEGVADSIIALRPEGPVLPTDLKCDVVTQACVSSTLKKGEWVEYRVAASHLIKANNPVEVGHFMTGSNYEGHVESCGETVKTGIGDPASTIGVAIDQYLTSYVFLTPPGYTEDWLNVSHKVGVAVFLDGKAIGVPQETVSSTGYAITRVQIQDGVHEVHSSEPFGITAFGYDCDVSYAFPGGMLLKKE
jgi:hypothetical protein